jgi:hypothetical protein
MAKDTYNEKLAALKRFARTIVPQIPAVLAYLSGLKPEWTTLLVFLGAVVSALDKYFRDTGFYPEPIQKLIG